MKKRTMPKISSRVAWRKLIRPLLVVVITLTASSPGWAKLTALADRTVIDSNETLQLTLRYDAQVLTDEPDFAVLRRDFNILSNNRQQQFSMINGRTESFTDWKLTLTPKRPGRLLIPSIKFKQDFSDAIEITVRKASPSNATGQAVYTETLVDKTTVYVQEQLLLTHRLYTSVQLTDLSLEELAVPGAIVQKTSQNQFRKRIDKRDYIVVEMVYALFPQTSGELEIPAIGISAFETANNSQSSFFRSRGNQLIRNTETKTINVLAKPVQAATDQWMPSSQLQLSQQWSSDLDQLVVGEPITRTVTISAKGLTGAQIQPLRLEPSSDYKVYPDQAQYDEQVAASGITGIRRESFALVPNREGKITLPEISIGWWDTVNKRMQTATLAAVDLQVGPAPANSTATNDAYLAPIEMIDSQSTAAHSNDGQLTTSSTGPSWLLQLSLALNALLLALLAALLLKRPVQHNRQTVNRGAADSPRLKLKQSIKTIETAAATENLAAVREAILSWGRCAFPGAKIKTLEEIVQLCPEDTDPALWSQFKLLDQNLYNREPSEKVDIKCLVAALKSLDVPAQRRKTSSNGLKPLYPTENIG